MSKAAENAEILSGLHEDDTSWTWGELVFSFPVRLGCYAVMALGVFQGVYYGVEAFGSEFAGAENGPVENAQVLLAIVSAVCFFYAAFCMRKGRAGMIVCGAMVGYAAARESDNTFEALFFDDAYKWLVGLPLFLIALSALWIYRSRVVRDALWLVRQPAVALFAIAGIYLCTMCQVLDRPEFWSGISSQDEANATKAMIEEFAELFAYLALAFAGIEALAMAHQLDEPAANSELLQFPSGNEADQSNPFNQTRAAG